jgi:hypothetical protein
MDCGRKNRQKYMNWQAKRAVVKLTTGRVATCINKQPWYVIEDGACAVGSPGSEPRSGNEEKKLSDLER